MIFSFGRFPDVDYSDYVTYKAGMNNRENNLGSRFFTRADDNLNGWWRLRSTLTEYRVRIHPYYQVVGILTS